MGHALAHTTLSVETRKGAELSRRFLEEALHALRFLGGFLYREADAPLIAEVGEVHRGGREILALKEHRFAWYHDETGPLYPFELTGANLRRAESLGLTELQTIMRKDVEQRTEIEKALLNAVFWVSRAQTDDSTEGRFVKFCIGMESILLTRRESPKGESMAKRLASLLSGSPQDRDQIFEISKNIYNIRSEIVHEGFSPRGAAYSPITRHYALQSTSSVLTQYRAQGWTMVAAVASWLDP